MQIAVNLENQNESTQKIFQNILPLETTRDGYKIYISIDRWFDFFEQKWIDRDSERNRVDTLNFATDGK